MQSTHSRWTRAGALLLVAAATLVPAVSAEAKAGDIIERGSCSGNSHWKLKASPENGRIEVEGQVDSNKVGQKWDWKIKHNGSLSASGTKKTSAPSGSFEVRRVLVDVQGDDRIVWKAKNPKSDETCRGALTF